jgi:hypothetical protein
MRSSLLIALAAAATLTAGAAIAQTAQSDTSVNPVGLGATPAGVSADGQFASSATLGDTSKLKAGDPGVVSNGPVPDTPQNRAAYGKPLSNAGRHTAPTGD